MENVLLVDDITFGRNSYGGDLRLVDSVLSATGFGSLNFTPINIDRTISPPLKRSRIAYNDASDMQKQQFQCDICNEIFPLKKTRDRHQQSVHKQQVYPCSSCDRTFTRKDIRVRHQAEKHSGRRRTRTASSSVLSRSNADAAPEGDDSRPKDVGDVRDERVIVNRIPQPANVDLYLSTDFEDFDLDEEVIVMEGPRQLHDCLNPLVTLGIVPASNPLLLCTNLLIRCKPYKRFYIHDRKRDLVSRKKWRNPDGRFLELYNLAIRTLSDRLASGPRDAELLAAVVALTNVDFIISGADRIGHHAKAMYSMKTHRRSQRDAIFGALEAAFEHCGKTCRSVRIIYTKHGFVWMLNMGYRCLKLRID